MEIARGAFPILLIAGASWAAPPAPAAPPAQAPPAAPAGAPPAAPVPGDAPSAPAAPAAGVESEVSFPGHGGFELQGTLLVPAAEAPEGGRRAVLLLPGSGPTDRNGNQPPLLQTDLLRQIAERLAAEGVTSLRFDKRACPAYAAQWPKDAEAQAEFFAFEPFVGDAAGALRFLRAQPEVNAQLVGIVGHSEGGLLALAVAADAPASEAPRAVALLATAGRTLDELVREQIAAVLRLQGVPPALQAQYTEAMDKAIDLVKREARVPDDVPAGLKPLFNPSVAKLLHSYFTIDPAALCAKVRGDVLVLNGSRDMQVSPERDAPRLAEALRRRDGGTCELAIVEGASHNLKAVSGDADAGPSAGVAGPVVPEALDRIAAWSTRALTP